MNDERAAVSIGKQISNLQRIFCPCCMEHENIETLRFKQNLVAIGDFENELFCPYCKMRVLIICKNTGG